VANDLVFAGNTLRKIDGFYTQRLTAKKDEKSEGDFKHHPILLDVLAQELKVDGTRTFGTFLCLMLAEVLRDPLFMYIVAQIKDFELALYDTQESVIGGVGEEFIFSPRLDNLMMSYTALTVRLRYFRSAYSRSIVYRTAQVGMLDRPSSTAQSLSPNAPLSV
jgi:aspartyl aminopeptidase